MSSYEIKSNSELTLDGKPLQIGEYISNGATANVFRGKYGGKDVAVKAIREGARAGFYSEFANEVNNLRDLWGKWEEHKFAAPQVVPALYGYDVESEYPILVEEFIDGKKLDHAMQDLPEGVFSEPQALFLAAQIGRILVILHNNINKCYGDIKFNNFLIVGDARNNPEPALKIFDWNVLGYSTGRNIQKDLLIVSNYVLFMLTGELPLVDQDSLQVNKRLVEIKGFKDLTSGTRHFIETALHSVTERRFETAQKWLGEVEKLLGWWNQEPSTLMSSAKADRAKADRASSLVDYLTALAKAEILEKKGMQDAGKLREEIFEVVSGDKVVEKVVSLLWGGQHNTEHCINIFNDAYRLEQYRSNEKVMLWGWLVKAVHNIPRYWDRQMEFQNSMDARLTGNYDVAYKGFNKLSKDYAGVQPLIDLFTEALTLSVLKDVSEIKPETDDDFNSLNKKYQQAFDLSNKIPPDLQKIAVAEWNVEKRLSETTEKLDALIEARILWDQAKNEANESSQIEKIGDALERTPVETVILFPLKEMIYQALDAGNYEHAERLARLPSLHGHNEAWFENAVRVARNLTVLKNDCQRLGVGVQSLKPINAYLAASGTNIENHKLVFPTAFVLLFKEKLKAAQPLMLADNDLEMVDSLLKLFLSRFPNEDSDLEQLAKSVPGELKKRRIAHEQNQSEIDNLLGKMRAAREQVDRLREAEQAGGNEMLLAGIQAEKNQRILKVVENLAALKKVDPFSPEIGKCTVWLNSVNLNTWLDIRSFAEDRIRSDQKELSKAITEYLNKGNLSEAEILLKIAGQNKNGELQARYEKMLNKKKNKVFKVLAWGFGIVVLVAGLIVGGSWILRPKSTPTSPPVSENITVPPTPLATTAPTTEPTPLPSPTSFPDSQYPWKTDVPGAPAALPPGVEPLYLLDGDPVVKYFAQDTNTWFVPEGKAASEGMNGNIKYANNKTKDAYVEWPLDVPVKQAGLYAFFINDTKRFSWISQPIAYQVFVGEELVPRKPDFGQVTIQLLKSDVQSDGGEWRCIGMYFLSPGDVPKVRMNVPVLIGEDTLGADALGIAFVPDVNPSLSQSITYPDILYWADDAQATYEPSDGWSEIEESATWLGAHKLELETGKTASVTWRFTERLSPGMYEVVAFIPAELTVDVSFDVLLNTNSKIKKELPANSGAGGSFQSLGFIEVRAKLDSLPLLIVTMKSKVMDIPGFFAYDNIVLVPVVDTPAAAP